MGKKSFIISTFLAPLLIIGMILAMTFIMYFNSADTLDVTVVDRTGRLAAAFDNDPDHDADYRYTIVSDISDSTARALFTQADGDIYAMVILPADIDSTLSASIYSDAPVKMSLTNDIGQRLDEALSQEKIDSYQIPQLQQIIADSHVSVNINSVTWSDNGEEASSSSVATGVGLAMAFMTYLFVLMIGAMIMSSVVEDKTNRIVEVIVSSCKPMELMMGKMVGIGLVGLTQIAMWVALGAIALMIVGIAGIIPAAAEVASNAAPMTSAISLESQQALLPPASELSSILMSIMAVNWVKLIAVFVAYFIGGYLLFGSLFAGVGSAVDQPSDAAPFTAPLSMIVVAALIIGQACIENPDGSLAVVCSYIPFTSPVVMMIRLPYDIPMWEVAASLALLYLSAIGCIWVAARVYRTGILMYGRKVTYRDFIRWIVAKN